MKYLLEFGIILAVSFAGELMKYILPFSVPASVYGLLIMLLCLICGVIKLEMIENAADFLIKIMPLMFIPSVVGLMEAYSAILPMVPKLILVIVATTVCVMAVCGRVTQMILNRRKKNNE